MTFSCIRRPRACLAGKINPISQENSEMQLTIPAHFQCPISLDLMKDPVTLSTGITYDRESIEKWIEEGNQTCPVTNQVLTTFDLIPNHAIRKMIQDWSVDNKSYGIERIPTPKIVISSHEIVNISSRISVASERGDGIKCREMVRKIMTWANESERNKKMMIENGLSYALSSSFESFSSKSIEKHEGLLEEVLSLLTWMFPLGSESQSKLVSSSSLRCMAWFLRSRSVSAKQNAVIVIKKLVSSDQQRANVFVDIEDVPESLFKLIKEPISPTATKTSLMAIYYMISNPKANEKIISKFVKMGLISLLLEVLVDSDRSMCQKALEVLDCICVTYEGREIARNNKLTVPVTVKKILRVSPAATELSVSILWKLCENGNQSALVEAIEVGGFQKVLVILQMGCGEKTKAKATELLKLMNQSKKKVDCLDTSADLRYLKKSY